MSAAFNEWKFATNSCTRKERSELWQKPLSGVWRLAVHAGTSGWTDWKLLATKRSEQAIATSSHLTAYESTESQEYRHPRHCQQLWYQFVSTLRNDGSGGRSVLVRERKRLLTCLSIALYTGWFIELTKFTLEFLEMRKRWWTNGPFGFAGKNRE